MTKQTEKSGNEKKSSEKNQNTSNENRRNCFRCGKPDHSFRTCKNPPLKDWEVRKKHLVMMGEMNSDSDEDSDEDEARIPDNSGVDTAADYNDSDDQGSVTGFDKVEGN